MTDKPPTHSLGHLRELTTARVGLGRAGASLPTRALLEFTLDHARARDAVHAAFDVNALLKGLADLGLDACRVSSAVPDRANYLARPDLGRVLDPESLRQLETIAGGKSGVAIVIGDGLSPTAVNTHAVGLLHRLLPLLAADAIDVSYAIIASGARVALGDQIGAILGARMVVLLIGERPGLSAADSLGVYLTFDPRVGTTDQKRNCISNIHRAGLGYEEAAFRIGWLIREGLQRELTGVALKDESGGHPPHIITGNLSRRGHSWCRPQLRP